jgi:hypothetical protein
MGNDTSSDVGGRVIPNSIWRVQFAKKLFGITALSDLERT